MWKSLLHQLHQVTIYTLLNTPNDWSGTMEQLHGLYAQTFFTFWTTLIHVFFWKEQIYCIFSNLIRTSFSRFLKWKMLVRGCNPHLSFNRPLHTAPSEVARWVSAACKAIPESIIIRSFKKWCISNALDGSEDDILWGDDGEDKDDSDWVMITIQLWVTTASLMNNKL